MNQFSEIISQLLSGLGKTLSLFILTLIFSLPLGLVLSLGSKSKIKPLKYAIKALIWVIRGTPLMLQVLLVSFLPMYLFKAKNKELASALNMSVSSLLFVYVVIAFIINYACYFSEIFRGGIESIPKGQYEAGKVLGLTKGQTFRQIILLQSVKKVLPPISNEVITLVKDTALAEVLGVIELLNAANHAVNEFVVLTPLLYAGIFYLVVNGLLTILFSKAEKKLSYFKE